MNTEGYNHQLFKSFFQDKNQFMEFLMKNEMIRLEEKILRDEEFLSAFDALDGYFCDEIEESTLNI